MMQMPDQEVLMLRMRTCHSPGNLRCSAVTLRHPKECAGVIPYYIESLNMDYDFKPEVGQAKQLSLASSVYDGEQITITCFPSDEFENGEYEDPDFSAHRLILFKRMRGGSDSYGDVAHWTTTEHCPMSMKTTMTTGVGASGTMEEPIYLATNVVCTRPDNGFGSPIKFSHLRIYRYEPDPESWVEIGNYNWTQEGVKFINDVALSAVLDLNGGDDLIVFWMQDCESQDNIHGFRIEDAATRNNSLDINEYIEYYEIDTVVYYYSNIGPVINADWDESQYVKKPRLTWTQYNGSVYETRVARVELDAYGQPDSLTYTDSISGSENSANPILVMNRSKQTDSYDAFTMFYENSSVCRSDLLIINGVDDWQSAVTVDEGYGLIPQEHALTYRYFGVPLNLWKRSGVIQADHRIISDSNDAIKPILSTNRNNRKDIFCSFAEDDGLYQGIIIKHLEP